MPQDTPPLPHHGRPAQGLALCRAAASDAAPRYLESNVIAPIRTIGVDEKSSLKASFWHSTVEETIQLGDLDFISIAMNLGGGRVWRNSEPTPTEVGAVAMQPFEGARWRFEHPVTFVHLYVPFRIALGVCESLFDRELGPAELQMPAAVRDEGLCKAVSRIQLSLSSTAPTNLILDSWSLILSELVLQRFSSHAQRHAHPSFGRMPDRNFAHVIDCIEASIDQDLRLASLANVAAMSVYHFARRFKETVGMSPHAYVLSRRVDRARQMLRHRDSSLADVAAACGFSSQAHFTTAFRSAFGATPNKYRRFLT